MPGTFSTWAALPSALTAIKPYLRVSREQDRLYVATRKLKVRWTSEGRTYSFPAPPILVLLATASSVPIYRRGAWAHMQQECLGQTLGRPKTLKAFIDRRMTKIHQVTKQPQYKVTSQDGWQHKSQSAELLPPKSLAVHWTRQLQPSTGA